MKKIVVINQNSGYLVIDTINALAERNFDITLITGHLVVRNKQLSENVKIKNIVKYNRDSKIKRLLTWSIAFIQILFIIKTRHRKDYLYIFTNPPFNNFLPLLCRNQFSFMVFDVYPDVLVQTGIIHKNSRVKRFWEKMNTKAFSKADNLFTLSERMASLVKQYSGQKKVEIMPLWGDTDFFKPISKETNPFVIGHRLENRFVVLYSGNLGATHNVEIFAEIAKRITLPEVIFVIIGEGDGKKNLEDKVQEYKLDNILLLPLQPVETIPFSFAAADLAMVSLGKDATGLSLPSKTFSFLAAGLPLLCIASEDSELNSLVTKYRNGRCFEPSRLDDIVDYIVELAQNKELLDICKANSLKASNDFTPKNAELIAEKLTSTSYNL